MNSDGTTDAPAGADQRIVGRHAERAPGNAPTDSPDSSAVGRTEGRVPLEGLKEYLEREAAEMDETRRLSEWNGWANFLALSTQRAADCRRWLADLEELRLAPRPKSDRSEGDRCPACGTDDVQDEDNGDCWCQDCDHVWTPRAGVSGACPPNDPIHP